MSKSQDSSQQPANQPDPQSLPPRRTQRPLIILGAVWFGFMILLLAYLALTQA
ncbi:MAG: hypothetical protein U1A77_09175 [Pirellulales bacterium]